MWACAISWAVRHYTVTLAALGILFVVSTQFGLSMQNFSFGFSVIPVEAKPFQAKYDSSFSGTWKKGAIYRDSKGSMRLEDEFYFGGSLIAKIITILDTISKRILVFQEGSSKIESQTSPEGHPQLARRPLWLSDVPDGASLGNRTIEGLECLGFSRKGRDGADVEYWISTDLELIIEWNVLKEGQETEKFRIYDLVRSEPEKALFEPPGT